MLQKRISYRDRNGNREVAGGAEGAARRGRPWWLIEVGFGVLVLCLLAFSEGRVVLQVWTMVAADGARALVPLLQVDGPGTAATLMLGLGRLGLAMVPAVLLIRASPRHRWWWLLPLVGMLVVVSSPVSLAACATPDRWLLLALISGVVALVSRHRYLAWTVVLPFVVLWEVFPSHGMAAANTAAAADRERMLAECAGHPGRRPSNLTADRVMPYHGVTALTDDLVLLTGEGPNDGDMHGHDGGRRVGSWWMRRAADGDFQFALPSEATGNLWRGCALDDTLWYARANRIVGVVPLPPDVPTQERVLSNPIPAGEMDFSQSGCDPERGRVYVSEAYNGGTWAVAPASGAVERHPIGGAGLWPKRRFDGRIIFTDTASIAVFDPATSRVIERVPAALVSLGSDVCDVDGRVAVPDMLGRLRVFALDAAGQYRFAWGVPVFAPRRVAFSRDCSRIAVTSADDRRVFVVDTATQQVIEVLAVGPALREVAATGPREFSISDSCSMTTYRW